MKPLATLFLLVIAFNLQAQKLPNVQQVSLRAPANIKIDGKDKEWNGQFQAYNNTTGIFYTIANDDENLYMFIYSNNVDFTEKILVNGIVVSFNSKKKSTNNAVVVKYPIGITTPKDARERELLAASKLTPEELKSRGISLQKFNAGLSKHVKVLGVSALPDTTYSIYDAKGIMVNLDLPGENLLYYELSVPLRYLGVTASAAQKLNYNIRLNENFAVARYLSPSSVGGKTRGGNDEGSVIYATDFWGEYTLAK